MECFYEFCWQIGGRPARGARESPACVTLWLTSRAELAHSAAWAQ
jgi:hypothetical protein